MVGALTLVGCGSGNSSPAKQVQTIMSNTFTSDPTLQDSNADGVPDWVIRDRESDHFAQDTKLTIQNGVFHSEGGDSGGDCLDSRPRMDYPAHTELVWSARIVVAQGNIGGFPGSDGDRKAHDMRLHVVQAVGFGIE